MSTTQNQEPRVRDYTGFAAHDFSRVLREAAASISTEILCLRTGMHSRDIRKFIGGDPPYEFIGLDIADRMLMACDQDVVEVERRGELTTIPGSARADAVKMATDEYWLYMTNDDLWFQLDPTEVEEQIFRIFRSEIEKRADSLQALRLKILKEALERA